MATQTSISTLFPQDIAVGDKIKVTFLNRDVLVCMCNFDPNRKMNYNCSSNRDGVFIVDKIEKQVYIDTDRVNDLGIVLVLRDEQIQRENHKVSWVVSLSDGIVYSIRGWSCRYALGTVTSVVKL